MWGVYVHAPWCARRCPYCAFAVSTDPPRWEAWSTGILRDWERHQPDFPGRPVSIYLGGGTPSLLPPRLLASLLRQLGSPVAEVTAEVNPEDASEEWLDAALEAGVNRISLGVQTLHPGHSRRLGRLARPDACLGAAERVRSLPLRSWSADLMFALPGQALEEALADVEALLSLDPPHVSLYGLTWEAGTPYARGLRKGILTPVDDESWRAMYEGVVARLEEAGLRRYEVSNAARPGHESVHNRLYWTDAPYVGLGPSAHGYAPDGRRWSHTADLHAWSEGHPPRWEAPTPAQRALDILVSTLRGRDGVDLLRLERLTAHWLEPAAVAPMVDAELVITEPGRIRLGPRGWPVADAVTRTLASKLKAES